MRSEYQWHFKANKTGAYLKTKYTERTKKRAGAHTHAQNQSGVPHKQTQKKIKKNNKQIECGSRDSSVPWSVPLGPFSSIIKLM